MPEKEKIRNFTDLIAWKEAHQLCLDVYRISSEFPSDERFGLIAQMRRAAVSITSNIAEGFGRRTQPEKNRFFDMAIGSVCEVQSQLFLSKDLLYLATDEFQKMYDQSITVHKIINGLIQRAY